MDKTATTLKGGLEARNPFEGLTFSQQVQVFMQTGCSLALGIALCFILMIAIALVYSMYLEEYEKTTVVPRAIEKLRKFMVNKEPLLEGASDGDILVETQKLADELATWTKKTDELNLEIRDVTKKIRLDWVNFKGAIYLFGQYSLSWPEAKDFCQKEKATMTCIDNEEEQMFIVQQIKEAIISVWIGFCYYGEWTCYDGTPLRHSYWVIGEPDNFETYCACVKRECTDKTMCWATLPMDSALQVVCRRKPDKKWSK